MFGQGGSTFGNQNTTFGQSAFGAAKPTGFGTTTFGATGTATPSLFGATPQQPTTNLFGGAGTATPFGQTQSTGFGTSTPATGFGGFGAATNAPAAGTSLFGGGTSSLFGATPQQPAASTGSLFGTTTSTFGNKPAFGGFGTTGTSLFGQTSQPASTGGIFGQPQQTTASTGLFGSTPGTSAFGSTLGAQPGQSGTAVAKFKPLQATDTVSKNNTTQTVQVRHQVITCMPEYEAKSFEELRLEDYQANRKGPGQGGSIFGAQPTTGLFGATATSQPSTGGLFGQQKPLFGSTSAAPALGTTTSLFGQQPAQQQTSLFGTKPFGAATTTTASGFGFGSTTTSTAGGLFGNKPFGAAAPTTSLFGTPATTSSTGFGTTSTGFGGFGTAAQTTSPFAPKPAFGATSTASPFSFAPAQSSAGSLFGTQAKPAFGAASTPFGAATTTTPSLFTPATSTTPFGATSQTGFGGFGSTTSPFAKPAFGTSTGFGTTPSLFGTQPAPTAAAATPFGGTGSLFGTAPPSTGLFGQPPPTQQAPPAAAPPSSALASQLMAMSQSTFSDNPVLRNIIEGPTRREDLLKPALPPTTPTAKNGLPTYYRVSPRMATSAKPVALTPNAKVGLFDGLEEDERKPADDLLFKPRQSVKKLTLKPKTGTSRIIFDLSGAQSPASEVTNGELTPGPKETIARRPPALDDTTTELIKRPPSVNRDRSMMNESINASMNATVNETHIEPHVEPEIENVPPHPLGIKCRRYGYYTIPSLEELAQMEADPDGAVVVENFVVGREGYGNILFKGPINVVDLDIDRYVHILHKQVNVYPNDDEKPPMGQEFNRKAQVTLDRVWPLDKGAGVEIRDPKRLEEMRYREKLQHCSAKSGAFFKEYRPETGSWVFDVPHFSKYGLEEADEDEERENLEASPVAPQYKKPAEVVPPAPVRLPLSPLTVIPNEDSTDARLGQKTPTVSVTEDRERYEENREKYEESREVASPVVTSGPRQLLAFVGAPVQKTQLNKLSMFGDADQEMDFGSAPLKKRKSVAPQGLFTSRPSSVAPPALSALDMSEMDQSTDLKRTSFRDILDRSISLHYKAKVDVSQQSFRDARPGSALSKSFLPPEDFDSPADYTKVEPGQTEPERLRKIVPKFGFVCPVGEDNSLNSAPRVLCDKDLFNGRRGRVSWNNKMAFAAPGVDNRSASLRLGASPFVASLNQVQVENLNPTKPSKPIGHLHLLSNFKSLSKVDQFKPGCGFYGKMLMAELEKSIILEDESGHIHRFNPAHGTALLESQLSAVQNFLSETKELGFVSGDMAYINYIKEVLALCSALWGKLPDDIKAGSYAENAYRKKLLGDWLREYASLDTFPTGTSTADFALADLTGERVSSACERLINAKDYNAAFALAQVETHQAQQFTGSQLEQWTATGTDRFIDRSRLRLHCQLAGFSTYKGSSFSMNTCEKFAWRQAFAHHFWYVVPGTGTIADALNEFDLGCNEGYAAKPVPAYLDQDYADRTRDLCYRLLQLYCYRKTLLEPLLNPASSTADPVEHTMSYLLLQLLQSLGYSHFTEHAEGTVLTSFAAQLEALDQWTWAVFVGMHLKNPVDREAFVKGILARHVTVQTDPKSESEISFLLERLCVPRSWIATAASYRAQALGLHPIRAKCLVEAGLDNEAHRLIVDRLGPDAVLGKRTELVASLLEILSEPERCTTIFNWSDAGEIYLCYFRMLHAVDELLDSDFPSAGDIEKLLPQVMSLCGRVANLPTPTAKHKLVQSKMAKRTAEALRNLLKVQNGGQLPALQILPRITQLPLPEDAAMEELQNVLRSYTLENAYDEVLDGMEEE